MLPIVDKPVMQFVVEEAVNAGVPHILMVTGRNKNALENHFDRAFELETLLDEKGESLKLSKVMESTDLADIHYVRQGDALGLGHAVSKARSFVGNEPFALLLGDEIIHESDQLLPKMLEIASQETANVIALIEVPIEDVHRYGIVTLGEEVRDGVFLIENLVEKPDQAVAPSRFAIVGRYVLQPGVFDAIESTQPGAGGEIQLTDALSLMAKDQLIAGKVLGVVFRGQRYDTGDKLSFLKATVQIAADREDLGTSFVSWLKDFVQLKNS